MESDRSLTAREEQVVSLLMQGGSNKQIAATLHISQRTVEFHLKNIFDKLKVSSRLELVLKLGKATGDFSGVPVESTVDGADEIANNGRQTGSQNGRQSPTRDAPVNRKEFAMTREIRTVLSSITILMGIILILGGIMTDKFGAVVVGFCVCVAVITYWFRSKKQPGQGAR
jgi:DNA-binding CsgD family transcriptional regulator